MESAMKRLTHYLIAKSIIEALFVGVLAVGFYLSAFPPFLRGEIDEANAQAVKGWAVDQSAPQSRVEVQLYLDGRFIASRNADQSRPDVRVTGFAQDDWHGFIFNLPALGPGEHEAQVYAMHASGGDQRRTLQLVGKPTRFMVGP